MVKTADPGRQQLRPHRHALPVPARLRHLRRARLGLRARGLRAGNNQESSSEGMNFANAADPVGPGDRQHRGPRRAASTSTPRRRRDRAVLVRRRQRGLPGRLRARTVGMVWGDGGAYATWFTANPEKIQGINMLPITGGSLYLGDYKADVAQQHQRAARNNGGTEVEWQDSSGQFLALADPAQALANYGVGPTPRRRASRKAHTYHWITSLDTSARPTRPSPRTSRRTPCSARTAPAPTWPTTRARRAVTVTFSDGQTLSVPGGVHRVARPGRQRHRLRLRRREPDVDHDHDYDYDDDDHHDRPAGQPGRVRARSRPSRSTRRTACSAETTTDTGGGQNIGWLANGDWALLPERRLRHAHRHGSSSPGSPPARRRRERPGRGAAGQPHRTRRSAASPSPTPAAGRAGARCRRTSRR